MLKAKNIFVSLLSLLCITLLLIVWFLTFNNNGLWYVNIASYSMPFLLISIILAALVLLLLGKYFYTLFIVVCLLFLNKPLTETFSLGYLSSNDANTDECPLNVMSFNVSTFNKNRDEPFMDDDSVFRTAFFKYLKKAPDELDIICLQEFHNDDTEKQRVIEEIVKYTGTNYYYTVPIWESWNDGFFGIITMSKYPIINKGTLFTDDNAFNRGIFTDIVYQKDTIRIINIHLHSMNIRWSTKDSTITMKEKLIQVTQSLKEGSKQSKFQIDQVLKSINNSPYPILLCGDFNTFPYGYPYQQVKKILDNSFEKSGKGFGFTLNLAPFFIRLDNQFSSKEIVSVESKVIRTIDQSDHFPLVARYVLRK